MSLINEALKRAQEDAAAPPASGPLLIPVCDREPTSRAQRVSRNAFAVVGMLILFAGLLGGVLFLYAVHTRQKTPPHGVTGAAAADAERPVATQSPLAQALAAAAAKSAVQPPTSNLGKAWNKGESVARQVAAFEAQLDPPEAAAGADAPGVATPQVAAPASQTPVPSVAATAFQNKFRVSGIVGSGTDRMALINSKVLKCGDRIEGATIIAIEPDHVTVQLADERVDLCVTGLP